MFYFSGKSPDILLHVLDPETLEDRSVPFIAHLGDIALASDFAWTTDWPSRPDAKMALLRKYEINKPSTIEIINLQTAEASIIWEGDKARESSTALFWIAP